MSVNPARVNRRGSWRPILPWTAASVNVSRMIRVVGGIGVIEEGGAQVHSSAATWPPGGLPGPSPAPGTSTPAQQRVQDADRAAVVAGEHRGNVLRAAEQVTCGAHAGLPGVLAPGYRPVSAGSWAARWLPASR